ncbi:indoleacetamide hydrolase [Noviherbaspirillum cavernae]|uniref:Indoleacetamide hydrolase n=1 Tax=Noviherbaspirillum cavernae TaxID=2320862 RepID=A0A418X728_9BURK|nr:indoleacetamide hydrolase [Noviherbaspirillum cavernae]RJG08161.1 indoleacetamide hydrolase [Noviherbaspirillum cavernae]
MTTQEQLALSASDAIKSISAGRLTAVQYITTALDRARALSSLNTIITLNASAALEAAKRIDAMRAAGQTLPALAGMPIVVKDNINTKDLPTTAGTPALKNFTPNANAPTLQALLDAGAIIIGKANMHELAFGITSTNFSPFAGAVKNPYNAALIPGGSSGGTAAAISARIVPAGLGTDTGGSSRVPAALTGIVGLRPSVGNGGAERRYSGAGVAPISHTRDTVGPMGRTVADVALLDAVITRSAQATTVSLKGLRLGIPAAFWQNLDKDVAAVMESAKTKLAAAGVVFVNVDMAGVMTLNDKMSFPIALHEPIADIPAWLQASGVTGITLADIAAQVASPDVKGAFGAIMGDAFAAAYPDAINVHRPALRTMYDNYFSANTVDAIFFPTTPLPAVPIDAVKGSSTVSINGGAPLDEFGTFIRNTDPGSNAGVPGLSLPAGLTPAGLPVGMEIDGPVGSDKKLLGIGMAMEALFGVLAAPKV